MIGFSLCKDLEGDIKGFLEDSEYSLERKFDGDRCHISIDSGKIMIYNRRFERYTHRLPEIVEEIKRLRLDNCVLDGEVCYFQEGKEYFEMSRRRCSTDNKFRISLLSKRFPVEVKVFDIMKYKGESCIDKSYEERKTLVREVLREGRRILPVEQYIKNKRRVWEQSKKEGWEGVVLKRAGSRYTVGRTDNWYRVKHFKEEILEFSQYEVSRGGIILTNKDIRVAVNGRQSKVIKRVLEKRGRISAEIQYLNKTRKGRYRMITFRGLIPAVG